MSKQEKKLEKLAVLAGDFLKAAGNEPWKRYKHLSSAPLPPEECRTLQNFGMQTRILGLILDRLESEGGPKKKIAQAQMEILKVTIWTLEVLADLAVRNLGERAARHVTAEDRTAVNSRAFAKVEAPVLAKLFAPKQP